MSCNFSECKLLLSSIYSVCSDSCTEQQDLFHVSLHLLASGFCHFWHWQQGRSKHLFYISTHISLSLSLLSFPLPSVYLKDMFLGFKEQLVSHLFLHERVEHLEQGVGHSLGPLGVPFLHQTTKLILGQVRSGRQRNKSSNTLVKHCIVCNSLCRTAVEYLQSRSVQLAWINSEEERVIKYWHM